MESFLLILLAAGLVLLNAFFVAAEFGMVKLRHTRLEEIAEDYGLRGKILLSINKNLDAYLSACQLGITLASLGLGWVGEPAFSELLTPLFYHLNITSPHLIEFVSFFFAFSLLSFLHIVIGELMPKSLAIRQSEMVSLWTAVPLYGFYWLMYPAIWLLNSCSNFLLKLINLNKTHKGENFYSTDEIKLILSSSHLHGELTKEETEIIEHTLDFADLKVTDVMRPIEEMISLSIDMSIQELFKVVLETRYTRYPVMNKQKIFLGILHVKDLLNALYLQNNIQSIENLIRPLVKIPHHSAALDLFRKFQEGMPHFAIIYRGPEKPVGFITLDNLLHILVGRIKDEFHRTKDDWALTKDGGFIMNGNTPIYTVERALDIDIFTDEEVTTLYGLILHKLGSLPTVGTRVEFDNFIAIVESMKGTKILKVKIYAKIQEENN
ncbi:MAG TPA: hemolysin family protein [Gammaproteobacteria bacterium]|nr:hemolysin family protein [Gammaproteobacteria bacterium]